MYFLLTLAVIGVVALLVRRYFRHQPAFQLDYSFGNSSLKAILSAVQTKNFNEAETLLRSAQPNLRTLAIDHLALSCTLDHLQQWVNHSGGKGFDGLTLTVHYRFLNWSFEQTQSVENASKAKQKTHFENKQNAFHAIELVENNRLFFFEKNLRSIQLKMLNGEIDAAWNHFIAARNQEPEAFFPYIYVAECIQPKWGGDLKRIQHLLSILPELPEVRMCIMLKLMHDSFAQEENLFGGTMDELVTFSTEQLKHIDSQLDKADLGSELKFFLFNYMIVNAERLGNRVMKKKYVLRSKGYTTIFPYGPFFRSDLAEM